MIRILDESLANKIAAGEVIERPASVVKELVENAIDAGATEVSVAIEEAGRKLIRVTDNGSGMTREDAVLALQRHATSKIATVEDLFSIRTLGFRGEALPSIAAVSHLRMTSRPHDAPQGTELLVRGGTITELNDAGCPAGTDIEVRQLFFNTPARLKFLKADTTEFSHIAELMNALALCHHQLDFRLTHNGRSVLARPAATQLLAHIATWLGGETALVPVALGTPGIQVDGYVGKPDAAKGNRGGQMFFVNGRRIVSRSLTHALEFAFQGLLTPGRYPVGVLKLTVDPEQVDVNVHPAKAEVRFHRERDIHAAVAQAVKRALGGSSMVAEIAAWGPREGGKAPMLPPRTASPLPHLTPATGLQLPASPVSGLRPTGPAYVPPASAADPMSAPAFVPTSGLRAIGQFHATFLLAESREALLLVNQHRAHERIIFDRLWGSRTHVEMQRLVLPATLHLGHREAALLESHLEALAGFGFDVEGLSGQSYLVRAVPAALAGIDPDAALRAILADLEAGISIAAFEQDDPTQRTLEEGRRRLLAGIACKGAIKANKVLTPQEQQHLLAQLEATGQPTTCPHGGPIIMTISRGELDRRFIR